MRPDGHNKIYPVHVRAEGGDKKGGGTRKEMEETKERIEMKQEWNDETEGERGGTRRREDNQETKPRSSRRKLNQS